MASGTSSTARGARTSGAASASAAPAKDDTTVATPAANVRQQEYAPGTGWEVGQLAPEDRYVAVGPDGADVGKPSKDPVKGYGRQVSIKGAPVTVDQRAALGLDKA